MSSSGYAVVMYGFHLPKELLRVEDGTKLACRNNESHDVRKGQNYCPTCGGRIEEVTNMVPSEVVCAYAKMHGISVDKAMERLLPFHRHCWVKYDKEAWVFGKEIVDAGSYDGLVEFDPHAQDSAKLNKLFSELGLDPVAAKYYLIAEIH